MKIEKDNQLRWFNTKVERLQKLREKEKELKAKIVQLEEEICCKKQLLNTEDSTIQTDKFSITLTPTISYEVSEQGFNAIMNEKGLESPFFKHELDKALVRKFPEYDQYVSKKVGKTKVTVKYIVLG